MPEDYGTWLGYGDQSGGVHEEDISRIGACQGGCGNCPCSSEFPAVAKIIVDRDPGDETSHVPEAVNPYYTDWEKWQGRHPNSQRFHALLEEAGELHDRKQRDYGRGDDPFANVRSSTDWGMPAWVGAMVRLNDKVKRLQKLAKTGGLANESAIDSFMDIAVYALIARVLYEEEA